MTAYELFFLFCLCISLTRYSCMRTYADRLNAMFGGGFNDFPQSVNFDDDDDDDDGVDGV